MKKDGQAKDYTIVQPAMECFIKAKRSLLWVAATVRRQMHCYYPESVRIVVHRREQLRATKVYHQPLMQAKNVEFQWNQTVKAVVSQDESGKMTGVRLEDVQTGEEKEVACDAVFVSVGRAPATQMLETQVVLDENGYIIADESTKTNLPGVFAVGDIRTKALRQIVTAAADGANAAYAVEEYLANK